MAKKEASFDLYIHGLLAEAKIPATPQGSGVPEIDAALKTASKRQTGGPGYPEYVAVVNGYVLVMEDKPDRSFLCLRDGDGCISLKADATARYAMNGALFYARKIVERTGFKKVFAFGNAGDSKHHVLQPIFVGVDGYVELPEVETFENFSESNIDGYFRRAVLGEIPPADVEIGEIIKKAKDLHESLRNYGSLGESEKPLVVSAILLALREQAHGFSIDELVGDTLEGATDGAKIFSALENSLRRAKVRPEVKKEQVLNQFTLIKDRPKLNAIHEALKKTPLKYFAEYINKNIYKAAVSVSPEDYLGRFYGEFVSYSGGNGQSLGVVLTPLHITELFCDLVRIKADDVVFDPCCGTGGFLITAMYRMCMQAAAEEERKTIRESRIFGIEARDDMFAIATTNMILRGDGRSNLICGDFFAQDASSTQLNGITVGLMNPPYSQAKDKGTAHLSELCFIRHLLDCVTEGGRVAVIVPVSAMIGKTREDKEIKREILKRHTLEGVISLNKYTFYRIGTVPCAAMFTAGEPHPKEKLVKFINFEDDGYEVRKHLGIAETERAKDRKSYLLECWRGRIIDAPSKFMVKTTVRDADEWVHSFYYYIDEIPAEQDFLNSLADYLTFEFSMVAHGRGYLFEEAACSSKRIEMPELGDRSWGIFQLSDIFDIMPGKRLTKSDMEAGMRPFIGATESNNGITGFVSNTNGSVDRNVLGVNYNGSVVETFYHPYECIFSDDVKRFKLKNGRGNRMVYLFLKTAIVQQKPKYTYIYKFNEKRMNRQSIMLPVAEAGGSAPEPDWQFMEDYIGAREQKMRYDYLSFSQS